MTALALRSLGARKFRAALTSLAIVLGVTMVAGTYVLTDTINQSFDEIFTKSNQGSDVVVQAEQAVDTQDGTAPPISASLLPKVAQGVRRRPPPPARSPTRACRSSAPTASRVGGNGAPTFGLSEVDEAIRPTRLRLGRSRPTATTRSRSTRRPPTTRASEIGDEMRIAGKESSRKYEVSASRPWPGPTPSAAPRFRSSRCPRRSGSPTRRGSSTRSWSPPTRAPRPSQLASNVKSVLPAKRHPGRDRRGERPGPEGRRRRVRRLPEDGAVHLRRRLAVRRRLPHLQHLLDHRRPAHPRVRNAAHPRRQPPPDRHLGRAGGAS